MSLDFVTTRGTASSTATELSLLKEAQTVGRGRRRQYGNNNHNNPRTHLDQDGSGFNSVNYKSAAFDDWYKSAFEDTDTTSSSSSKSSRRSKHKPGATGGSKSRKRRLNAKALLAEKQALAMQQQKRHTNKTKRSKAISLPLPSMTRRGAIKRPAGVFL